MYVLIKYPPWDNRISFLYVKRSEIRKEGKCRNRNKTNDSNIAGAEQVNKVRTINRLQMDKK